MSAIAGIFNLDGEPVARGDVENMLAPLAQRGPDRCGIWRCDNVALGGRLLWTTPESLREAVPFVPRESNRVLVADARIDNRDELLDALELQPALKITDAELILASYARWHENCAEHLIGDFAFALWDGDARKLFCARDAMGLKPFYYFHSRATFAFASEIKGLLPAPRLPRQLNETRVADHVALLYQDRASTFYRDVYQLPAAHTLTVSAERHAKRRYWTLDPAREIRLSSLDEYAEALREVFAQAVRARLRSEFPSGSMLSGGLDSSSIVCVANELQSLPGAARLHTFSAVFPSLVEKYPAIDERSWIDTVLAKGNFDAHFIAADNINPLQAITFHADEPLVVPNMYLDWGGFRAAQQCGVRAVLSGVDGDTVLSYGQGYFAELARGLRWRTLYREANGLARNMRWSARSTLWQFGLRNLVPPTARRAWRALRHKQPDLLPFPIPITSEFAQRIRLVERIRALEGDDTVLPRTARETHVESLLSGLNLYSCEVLDKAGAAFALEPRLPFFDRRMVEFCVALPPGLKLRDGWNRYIMRRAMQGILPEQVQWRSSKGDLSPNIRQGLWNYARPALEEVLLQDPEPIRPYLDVATVQDTYRRFAGAPMQSRDPDIYVILIAYTLGRWLRRAGFVSA